MTRSRTIERTCIACHNTFDKRDMVRIVRSADGAVSLDAGGRAAGRGAYICPNSGCFSKAAAKNRLSKALKTKISDEDWERLCGQAAGLMSSRTEC